MLVLLIVVAMVAAVAWVATREDTTAAPGATSSSSGAPAPSTATSAPSPSAASVSERYAPLAEDVTGGTEGCREEGEQVQEGIADLVVCRLPGARLELTTHSAITDLDATREQTMEPAVGSLMTARDAGSFYALDPTVAGGDTVALVYWDDRDALQSARLVGEGDTTLRDLEELQGALVPTQTAPKDPDADVLGDFASNYRLRGCSRVPVSYTGAVEENACRHQGNDVRLGRFERPADLGRLRESMVKQVDRDLTGFEDFWYYDTNGVQGYQRGEKKRGKVYGFHESLGGDETGALLYVDDDACRCYLVVRSAETDPRTLFVQLY